MAVKPYAEPADDWSYAAAASGIGNGTAVTIKTAAGVGKRNYVTAIQISHSGLGAATEIAIRDGAAGTVLWRSNLLQTTPLSLVTAVFQSPLRSSHNTLLEVILLTNPTSGGVYFNAQGYVAD